jgi:hypothetical protein
MSTTTTVSMAEAAVELQTLPPATPIRSAVLPPPHDNDNSEENTPSGRQSGLEQASRQFSVEPIVTIDRTKRFIITSLLVTANVIQVCLRNVYSLSTNADRGVSGVVYIELCDNGRRTGTQCKFWPRRRSWTGQLDGSSLPVRSNRRYAYKNP